jgi:hypothetical protein
MADHDPEQDNLFKEIDEDLRQQKYAELWKKYGKVIIGAAVLLIVGVASLKGWEAYDLNRKLENSKLLASALKEMTREKPENAVDFLNKLMKKGSPGYKVLARFNYAGILAKKGNSKGASTAYLLISEDENIEAALKDMALILSALHNTEAKNSSIFIKKLSRLINGKNAWRHSAKELVALLAQKSGDNVKAQKLYKELYDDATTPAGIRTRAAEMTAILNG